MVAPTGLVLTPAQRLLVEKSLAARRGKDESAAIQRAIEGAAQRHIDETKARCRASNNGRSSGKDDQSLIIRHVGEQLASVAKRELDPHKRAAKSTHASAAAAGLSNGRSSSTTTGREAARSRSANAAADGGDDDDDRFGPVRRPPRIRAPNLWVSVYEQEQADVKREQDEAKRKRLAAAEQYRRELAQQEQHKQRQRTHERAVADAHAQQQAQQVATWQALEHDRQRAQHDIMVDEAARCHKELALVHQQQQAAQHKKAQTELRAVERLHAQLAAEQHAKERAKLAQKREMALVQQANAKQLALKQERALRDQDDDRKLQAAYDRKVAEQDAMRQRELQAIVDKQSKRVQLALLHVPNAEERAREDEARAAAVQRELKAKEDAELQRRSVQKREHAAAQVAALVVQKAERRDKFVAEQAVEDAYAVTCKRDLAEWQQAERSKQLGARSRNTAHQDLVKQQMQRDEARRASDDKYGMSVEEIALNTALLQHAGVTKLPTDAPRTRKV